MSLARPGGTVTGQSSGGAEIVGKSVELVRELIPAARFIGVVAVDGDPLAKPTYMTQIDGATTKRPVFALHNRVILKGKSRWVRPRNGFPMAANGLEN